MRKYLHHHLVQQEDEEVVVIGVKEHKTGMSGSAKVLLRSADFSRVQVYATQLRPLLCPSNPARAHENLLLLLGGCPIHHLRNTLRVLERKYQVVVPTATLVRKAGTTATACQSLERQGF